MSLMATNAQGVPVQLLGSFHWLWCLLFGPVYYLSKGMVKAAIVSVITINGLLIIMPIMNRGIVRNFYVMRGWKPIA